MPTTTQKALISGLQTNADAEDAHSAANLRKGRTMQSFSPLLNRTPHGRNSQDVIDVGETTARKIADFFCDPSTVTGKIAGASGNISGMSPAATHAIVTGLTKITNTVNQQLGIGDVASGGLSKNFWGMASSMIGAAMNGHASTGG
jgi:hypothetical protein